MNFNSYISLLSFSDKGKLKFSLASVAAAVGLAVAVTGSTGDPVYAGVVAWALSAVASEKGWGRMKVRPEEGRKEGVCCPCPSRVRVRVRVRPVCRLTPNSGRAAVVEDVLSNGPKASSRL